MNRRELILSAALLTIFLMPCCNAAGRGAFTIKRSGVDADQGEQITQHQEVTEMFSENQKQEELSVRHSYSESRVEYEDYEEPHANRSHDPPIGLDHAGMREPITKNAHANTSHDPKIGH
ncbi:hypothetical protein KP509_27G048200 [Ceratopteris richardii]|uniref:Uncharacterized protein n=1 Tax=Ceratopteris richardii TaxID=49495 RepID=A0A8T2RHP8_CERRI|nr:hypothetical protein KP509_27G048200 [Ceratopteris richardii]KAH7295452.1 hypothetical protein KP509_27G048200 [Ceratopteris richardii]